MANLKKILLVDDEEDLREALAEQLVATEDFDVFEAGTGHDAVEKVKSAIYDLVILDVGLPDTDGRELCKRLRKQGVKCPIIMLTGHDTDADTILGLDAGANDYITKPFKFRCCWHASARSCASMNSPKMRCSSWGPIPSSRR